MSVLLKPDTITVLTPSRTLDEHGWAQDPVLLEMGTVQGTIQEVLPNAKQEMDGDSGHGPAAPEHKRDGTAYLDDEVVPGDVLRARGRDWRVLTVRFVEDPTGTGALDSWLVSLLEIVYAEDDNG